MAIRRLAAATSFFLAAAVCVSSIQARQDGTPKTPKLNLDVDVVLVNASVMDSVRNRPMSGLNKNNFQIWEDRVEQKITEFSSEDVPISVGIIFDVSGSMGGSIGTPGPRLRHFSRAARDPTNTLRFSFPIVHESFPISRPTSANCSKAFCLLLQREAPLFSTLCISG
jgi:hypothetical protein